MTRPTRRQLLASTATAGALALAGCSNTGSSDSGSPDDDSGDEQQSGITSLDTVVDKAGDDIAPEISVYLNVSLADRVDAEQVTLERTDVDGVTEKKVGTRPDPPQATMLIRGKYDSQTIPHAPYEVVARSSGGEPVASREWTPDTSVEYSNIEVDTSTLEVGPEMQLRLDITNTGDLDIEPPDGYISSGYPTDVHDSEAVGSTSIRSMASAVAPSQTVTLVTGRTTSAGTLLTTGDGECPSESRDVELTYEYPNGNTDKLDITLQQDDEPIDVDGDIIGCRNTTVEDWSKTEN